MGFLSAAFLGLLAGLIASRIIDPKAGGFPLNITLGIAGLVTSGFAFDLFDASGAGALKFWSTIAAITSSRTLCC
jgi:uncharacterized membrane protein YeaQ/YmgE (transglycosylase-associated protein family)